MVEKSQAPQIIMAKLCLELASDMGLLTYTFLPHHSSVLIFLLPPLLPRGKILGLSQNILNSLFYLLPVEDSIDQISCKDRDTLKSRIQYLITGSLASTDAMLTCTLLLFEQKKKSQRKLVELGERVAVRLSAYSPLILCVWRILEYFYISIRHYRL